jgi:hypothetical protein
LCGIRNSDAVSISGRMLSGGFRRVLALVSGEKVWFRGRYKEGRF